REQGLDPASVGFVQDLDGALLSRVFVGGMGDYLVVDYPAALALEARGGVHVVAPLAITGGDVPWSVYYALGRGSDERLDAQVRFARALSRGMADVIATPAAGYRDFLAETFPRLDAALLVRIVDEYRAAGMWTTPRIDAAAYDRWQAGIRDGHLIAAPIPYGDLIDRRATATFPEQG
ncbi:MAG: ABC transporter substrate-binding protein, partial [Microvirga sp.]